MSSRTSIFVVGPSRTDTDDVVVDITSLSELDVVEIKAFLSSTSSLSALDVDEIKQK